MARTEINMSIKEAEEAQKDLFLLEDLYMSAYSDTERYILMEKIKVLEDVLDDYRYCFAS
jgi:hypothetical protein